MKIKSCFINYNALLEVIKNYDFKCTKKSKILVKDLFKAVKADNPIYDKRIIFNDITPAY